MGEERGSKFSEHVYQILYFIITECIMIPTDWQSNLELELFFSVKHL